MPKTLVDEHIEEYRNPARKELAGRHSVFGTHAALASAARAKCSLRFKPDFCLTLCPGSSSVPLAEAVIALTARSSMAIRSFSSTNFLDVMNVVARRRKKKWEWQANFTMGIHICRDFFLCRGSPDIEKKLNRYILPIRPDRHDERKMKAKGAVFFLYRIA